MKKVFSMLVLVTAIVLTSGNAFSQSIVKETRNVSGFTGVGFGIAGELTIKFGKEFHVVLEGNSDYLPEVETVVRNGKLQISSHWNRIFNNDRVNVYITMPEINSLGLSGSGRAIIEEPIKADVLNMSVSGSGKILVQSVIADELKCSISGSGDIILEGTGEAGRGNLSISGSGYYRGENTKIKDLHISISGSGNCSCFASESLSAGISGSGNVTYSGNPRLDVRASGSGHVRSR